MNFNDIPSLRKTVIRVKPLSFYDKELKAEQIISQIAIDNNISEAFDIVFDNASEKNLLVVKTVQIKEFESFADEISRNSYIARIVNIAIDKSFDIEAYFFSGPIINLKDIDVGVDYYTVKSVNKVLGKELDKTKACKELTEKCVFKHGKESYFFFLAGHAMDDIIKEKAEDASEADNDSKAIESEKDKTEKSDSSADLNTTSLKTNEAQSDEEPDDNTKIKREKSFCLMGNNIRFVVTSKKITDASEKFIATKIQKINNQNDLALRLGKGNLSFSPWDKAKKITIMAQAKLQELIKDEGSYMKKWDEYGTEEEKILFEKAKRIQPLYYNNVINVKGCKQYKLKLYKIGDDRNNTYQDDVEDLVKYTKDALNNNELESFELVSQIPEYLSNKNITFEEYQLLLRKKDDTPTKSYKFVDFNAETLELTVEGEDLPKKSEILVWSFRGDMIQIQRRDVARKRILEGRSAIHELGLLIEDKGRVSEMVRKPTKKKALTNFVRKKIFKHDPTEKQIKAIDIALNTPDIALIQGPPGTGKTTVIAAILERLNEESDKQNSSKGRVLLSGFQHDAVENMIDRITVNSLPVFKFGNKRDKSLDGDEPSKSEFYIESVRKWCRKIAENIYQKYELAQVELEKRIRNLSSQYANSPSNRLAIDLLNAILVIDSSILGNELVIRIQRSINNLSKKEILNDIEDEKLYCSICNLRTKPESFFDDGPATARTLIQNLGERLDEKDYNLLKTAADWNKQDIPPFLDELLMLRHKLLMDFSAPPVFTSEKHNSVVLSLLEDALDAIKAKGYSNKNKKELYISEFLEELDNNPSGMEEAISQYSYAFAATCQQSVNKKMIEKKTGSNKVDESNIQYDYVIIDEAARVSPRDLMIPMVQGKKIILIGDHRQLPHIINDAVARKMEVGEVDEREKGNEKKPDNSWLSMSMFEYLFANRLKKLEEEDGYQRRVTLDQQYRMHPLLGDFVSKNFYEFFDSNERFTSGLSAETFRHNLPQTDNKPAMWINVPKSMGACKNSGTSWIRLVEALAIADQLKKWLASPQGKELTYGVISFYKAQADLIKKSLGTAYNKDQIRIGTVDSFQGMEFDVVFLSIVRTPLLRLNSIDKLPDEIKARKLFGHLCLYNRLNVAMSRQKKLLVAVGDSEFICSDLAHSFIPGVANFYDLCCREGVVINAKAAI